MIHQRSIRELRESITRQEFSVTEVVESFLDRIDQQEEKIKAFLRVDAESALAQAQALDQNLDQGRSSKRTADRHPCGHQGQYRHRGNPDDLRVTDSGELHSSL